MRIELFCWMFAARTTLSSPYLRGLNPLFIRVYARHKNALTIPTGCSIHAFSGDGRYRPAVRRRQARHSGFTPALRPLHSLFNTC